jgi:hypothetical protein
VRLRLGDLADALRGRRGARFPPPVVGVAMVVGLAMVVLAVGLLLSAVVALFV